MSSVEAITMNSLFGDWTNPALVAAIIAGFVSLSVSRRSLYVNAVTVQRSLWIEKLRANLANYSGLVHTLNFKSSFAATDFLSLMRSEEYQSLVREMRDLVPLLMLQLNPAGEIDKNIIFLIDRIRTLTESPLGYELRRADDLLILHGQWLLKAEWEKVKSEARSLPLRLWGAMRSYFYIRRYRKFCARAGDLSWLTPS